MLIYNIKFIGPDDSEVSLPEGILFKFMSNFKSDTLVFLKVNSSFKQYDSYVSGYLERTKILNKSFFFYTDTAIDFLSEVLTTANRITHLGNVAMIVKYNPFSLFENTIAVNKTYRISEDYTVSEVTE